MLIIWSPDSVIWPIFQPTSPHLLFTYAVLCFSQFLFPVSFRGAVVTFEDMLSFQSTG